MKKFSLVSLSVAGVVILSACGSESSGGANEETNFPTQELRIVIPYDPGGASDSQARALSEAITENDILSEDITVVNLPGANTRNGLEEVMNARPDGHTVLLHHSTLNSMNAVDQIDISYDDFAPVAGTASTPNVLVGNSDSPHQSFEDYMNAAEEDPGSISVGIPAVGSTAHLAYEAIEDAAGADDLFEVVPFQSGGDLITAHEGGQVDLRIASTPDAVSYVESGDVTPLVTTSEGAHFNSMFEDAESMSDFGYEQGVNVDFGVYAPKETPSEVIDVLESTIEEAVATDQFQSYVDNNGLQANYLNQEEFTELNSNTLELFENLSQEVEVEDEE